MTDRTDWFLCLRQADTAFSNGTTWGTFGSSIRGDGFLEICHLIGVPRDRAALPREGVQHVIAGCGPDVDGVRIQSPRGCAECGAGTPTVAKAECGRGNNSLRTDWPVLTEQNAGRLDSRSKPVTLAGHSRDDRGGARITVTARLHGAGNTLV